MHKENAMTLNRFHWFWIAILFVFIITASVFLKAKSASGQCVPDDLICISMP